jgi:hypothetical protein
MFNAKSERSNVTGLLFVVNTAQAGVLRCSFNNAFNWYATWYWLFRMNELVLTTCALSAAVRRILVP